MTETTIETDLRLKALQDFYRERDEAEKKLGRPETRIEVERRLNRRETFREREFRLRRFETPALTQSRRLVELSSGVDTADRNRVQMFEAANLFKG